MAQTTKHPDFPRSFGLLLYPQFELLDVAGPMEALNCLARFEGFGDMKLSVISETLDPVSLGPVAPDDKAQGFTGVQRFIPTHTLETAPHLDVLLVPGGGGSIDWTAGKLHSRVAKHVNFIRDAYFGRNGRKPLQHIISVCNGSMLLNDAGVLDGRSATTNKDGWALITALGPKTHWIARARWVADGNVWTTSGVSAGGDGTVAWMSSLLPEELVTKVVNTMEWIRADKSDNDPFAEVFKCSDVPRKES